MAALDGIENKLEAGEPLELCAFSSKVLSRLELRPSGTVSLAVDYAEISAGARTRRQGTIEALRIACELADTEIRSEHRLQEDLGLERIQLLALALHLENTFQIFLDEAPEAPPETVADVARLVAARLAEQGRDE